MAVPVPSPKRDAIRVLDGVSYDLYTAASVALTNDWLDGKIGDGVPCDKWEKDLIKGFLKANYQTNLQQFEFQHVYDKLIEKRVPSILRITALHRQWIRKVHNFLVMAGVTFSGNMEKQVRVHDLSKFTPEELLGYTIMFADGQDHFKQLDNEEKTEWKLALEHHYKNNSHHPEFYGRDEVTGQRDQTVAICDAEDGMLIVEESVVDMLASRGERKLKNDQVISVTKWLDMPEMYLKRYTDKDKQIVIGLLKNWLGKVIEFVKNTENVQKWRGAIDGRPVEV